MGGKVRIGIDVGGTFTDAVVIDNESREVLAKRKIPTTHGEGVAHGVVRIISDLMAENGIDPGDVAFIAHGTTQATNALLEGDVARVGIVGMAAGGLDARMGKKELDVGDIELAAGKRLSCGFAFIDSKRPDDGEIDAAVDALRAGGAEVIVASEAYGVDNPENELRVMARASAKGLHSTGGHEISRLYGLKMRTRTAVVNASLIPKMMDTANMTEQAVKDTRIRSNLMIMRCDGGVMDIDEVRRRPILTMLSGLAAGVAGALMHEKISDGVFFEVGGTSIDISVIKNGRVMIKYAQVGGHKTYLQSLDVRTMGIAGGSMIRVRDGKIVDVGPRSAHIAGHGYEAFAPEGTLEPERIEFVSPRPDDPAEYAVAACAGGKKYALTLAGAVNLLGYIPDGDYARGVSSSTEAAWRAFGAHLGLSAEEAARRVVDTAMTKLASVVEELIREYELDRSFIILVGGGGSASVAVPPLAEKLGMKMRIAGNAPYISTIGVAMAMVREQIERSVVNPGEEDIRRIRLEAIERIVKSGAKEETVDVAIEIDARKNILRAVATGATELRRKDPGAGALPADQLAAVAAEALGAGQADVTCAARLGRWHLFTAAIERKALFGLLKRRTRSLAVLDREGVVRLRKENAEWIEFRKKDRAKLFTPFLDENTTFSDANATIPKVFVFYREKLLDLSGAHKAEQLCSILDLETDSLDPEEAVLAVAYK